MVDKKKIGALADVWSLFKAVCEGAESLRVNPEDVKLKASFRNGLCVLKEHLEKRGIDGGV